jgi:hypothetical protein
VDEPKARLLARVSESYATLTWCSLSEAWITRTSVLPAGAVSWSSNTCRRSPDAGPTPATVYDLPAVTEKLVESTGELEAAAPAARIATVYWPALTGM